MKPKGFENVITRKELNAAQRSSRTSETENRANVEVGRRTAPLQIVEERRGKFDMVLKGLGATALLIGISYSAATFNHLSEEAKRERAKQEEMKRAKKAEARRQLEDNLNGLITPKNDEEVLVNQSDDPNVYK